MLKPVSIELFQRACRAWVLGKELKVMNDVLSKKIPEDLNFTNDRLFSDLYQAITKFYQEKQGDLSEENFNQLIHEIDWAFVQLFAGNSYGYGDWSDIKGERLAKQQQEKEKKAEEMCLLAAEKKKTTVATILDLLMDRALQQVGLNERAKEERKRAEEEKQRAEEDKKRVAAEKQREEEERLDYPDWVEEALAERTLKTQDPIEQRINRFYSDMVRYILQIYPAKEAQEQGKGTLKEKMIQMLDFAFTVFSIVMTRVIKKNGDAALKGRVFGAHFADREEKEKVFSMFKEFYEEYTPSYPKIAFNIISILKKNIIFEAHTGKKVFGFIPCNQINPYIIELDEMLKSLSADKTIQLEPRLFAFPCCRDSHQADVAGGGDAARTRPTERSFGFNYSAALRGCSR